MKRYLTLLVLLAAPVAHADGWHLLTVDKGNVSLIGGLAERECKSARRHLLGESDDQLADDIIQAHDAHEAGVKFCADPKANAGLQNWQTHFDCEGGKLTHWMFPYKRAQRLVETAECYQ